jgi:GT2 family glycosyltransferase
MPPRASVVVSAYNSGTYMHAALRSLVEQTIDDLEIVVIDDGSTDGTAEIARDLLGSSNRAWRVVSQTNAGVSAARNHGFSISTGQYLMFLDADDYLHPECLSALIQAMEDMGADMAFCGHDAVTEDHVLVRPYTNRYSYLSESASGVQSLVDLMRERILPWTGSTAYRRSLLDSTSLKYTEGRTYAEDIEFIWTAMFRTGKVACVKRVLSFYVQRAGSTTGTAAIKRFQGLDVLFSLLDLFSHEDPNNPAATCLRTYRLPVDITGLFGALAGKGIRIPKLLSILRQEPRYLEALRRFRPDPKANLPARRAAQVRAFSRYPMAYLLLCFARERFLKVLCLTLGRPRSQAIQVRGS